MYKMQGVGLTNFSQRIDPMQLQEIFHRPFSNNSNKKKKKKKKTAGGMPKTHRLRKEVAVEYLNGWFR